MTNSRLARSYLEKSMGRLKALKVLVREKAYSDLVRGAQEGVAPAMKAMPHEVEIEPPKVHDVGALLVENSGKFDENMRKHLETLAKRSLRLREEREFSFFRDVEFVPAGQCSPGDAEKTYGETSSVVEIASGAISGGKK